MIAAVGRRPGRPRDPVADQAILDAALEAFVECGFEGFSIEGVAARAGVGKATIYRRYPCKADLVMAAVARVVEEEAPRPDTGFVAEDLKIIGRGHVRLLTRTVAGSTIAQFVADRHRNAELARLHARYVSDRRALATEVVRRGIERGQLRPETSPRLVVDLLSGPIFCRYLLGESIDGAFVDSLVATIMVAFGR